MNKMRKYRSAAAVMLSVMSCYKDLSTEATVTLPEIAINSEYDVINISYGEELVLEPNVTVGGAASDNLEYQWLIALKPQNAPTLEIGDSHKLSYIVGNTPSSIPYCLLLKVNDPETGVALAKTWDVYVGNPLGEGLIVAHTRDRGATSEIDLVSAKAVTYGYSASAPSYKRNLYSSYNDGQSISGRVTSVAPFIGTDMAVYNTTRLMLGTEQHLLCLDYLTLELEKQDSELFNLIETDSYGVDGLFNFARYCAGTIIEGKLYGCMCHIDRKYSNTAYSTDIITPKNFAYLKSGAGFSILYDNAAGKFMFLNSNLLMSTSFVELPVTVSFPLAGGTPLACGPVKGDKLGFVIKDINGRIHACVIDTDGASATADEYDLTDAADIGNAIDFAFCDNAGFFYYTTPDAIHYVRMSGTNAVEGTVTWKPANSAEKITGIRQYSQAWYGTQQLYSYDFTLPYHRLQLVITTYDAATGEGKIYMRSYNVSTGLFLMASNEVYSGFGEITAVAPIFK